MSLRAWVPSTVVVVSVIALAAACESVDTADDEGGAGATTTGAADRAELRVEVPAFDSSTVPERFTCDGDGRSPEIAWDGVPRDAAVVALLVTDPDAPAGPFVHWTAWNVPVGARRIAEGNAAPGLEGLSSAGSLGWTPPCPPEGDDPHRYVFEVLALAEPLDLEPGAEADAVVDATDEVAIASGRVVATYQR